MSTFKISDEISLYLRARVPLIVLVTVEEQRAIAMLDEVRRSRGLRQRPGHLGCS
jgi:hypothetical protein